jgi:ribosomal protein S18 acetylase RimI-like enzyme
VSLEVLRLGPQRLRIGSWRGLADVAYIAPQSPGAVSIDTVNRCVELLASRGYRSAVTTAMGLVEAQPFLLSGFTVRERLHLLAHDMRRLPAPRASAAEAVTMRRARRNDRPTVLKVDHLVFQSFWQLDDEGLEEALTATPSVRFRVVTDRPRGTVAGYAVTGRAARSGFVQRLAVHPDLHGQGVGGALVLDGLGWLRRRGVDRAMVNTQETNTGALHLYEKLGFERQATGLVVLNQTFP